MASMRLACLSSRTSSAVLMMLGVLVLAGCGESTPNDMDAGTDAAVEMDSSTEDSSVECEAGKYGATCSETCDCEHGVCDDGRTGTGACTCDNGFAGDSCDTCATGFFGATCSGVCDCQNGTCDEGVNGTGACSCSANWAGAMCDDCEEGRYGATCTEECAECYAGTCNGGTGGDGACQCNTHATGTTCDTCQIGFYGADCEGECACLNGTCNEGRAGDGTCACNDGWLGETCEVRARSCLEILQNNPSAASGIYEIKPDSGSPLQVYCDMTTVGGGWMLVLNYVHAALTNPAFSIRGATASPPFLGETPLGMDGSLDAASWGHASPALLSRFTFSELRFYGVSSGTVVPGGSGNRVIHFMATAPGCANYFRTGSGTNGCQDLLNTWTPLPDHTAHLLLSPASYMPALATLPGLRFGSNRGMEAMTFEPFHIDNGIGWGLRVQTSRWEADDACFNYTGCATDNDKSGRSTIHRIWVR